LVVAIPTFVIYRYLTNKADSLILEMEENSIRMVDLVKRED
jgi:biopolymer transport protein ExbB/TolQ